MGISLRIGCTSSATISRRSVHSSGGARAGNGTSRCSCTVASLDARSIQSARVSLAPSAFSHEPVARRPTCTLQPWLPCLRRAGRSPSTGARQEAPTARRLVQLTPDPDRGARRKAAARAASRVAAPRSQRISHRLRRRPAQAHHRARGALSTATRTRLRCLLLHGVRG